MMMAENNTLHIGLLLLLLIALAVGGGGCGTRERSTMNDKKLTRLSLPDDVIAEEALSAQIADIEEADIYKPQI